MVYKALYRTYRPQKFSEVIGQDHIVRTLQNSIENNKISHAYLFSGSRGTGKTSTARIFAKALNCASPKDMEPCGVCLSCEEIAQSMSPDVVEIDAASNNGVDEIREIRDKVKFLPGGAKYKIYIIDEVHMLSQGAFNALLKTLEEPPKHVIFILATTEPHKVIPTILSRCQRFDFKTLNVQEISKLVKSVSLKEGFKISDEAIITISESAEGGMRDALSYLDQAASFTDGEITAEDVNSVTGNLSFDKIVELARYYEEKNINKALKTINDLVIMGKEVNKIVSSLLQFYRDCLLYKSADVSMFSKYIFEKEEFKALAPKLDTDKIFYYIDVLSEIQTKIKVSTTPIIYLEVATIKIINSTTEHFSYNKRINELEKKINEINLTPNRDFQVAGDDGKVEIIEGRLNKVIHELSKLELHKLTEKLEKIETDGQVDNDLSKFQNELLALKEQYQDLENKLTTPTENKGFTEGLSEIEEEIKLLRKEFEEIKSIPNSTENLDNHIQDTNQGHNQVLEERIQKLKDLILGIQSDMYAKRNEIASDFNLDQIKAELDNQYLNKFNEIKAELKDLQVEESISSTKNDSDLEYELNLVKEKINNIESKLYKLIAGELEKSKKRTKIKPNRKQIGLFGNEMVDLAAFKKPINEEVDFKSEEQETELEVEATLATELSEELVEAPAQEVETSKTTEDTSLGEELEPVITEKENKIIKTIQTDNEEIIEREKSSLVRKINSEPEPAIEEKEVINYSKLNQEANEEEIIEDSPTPGFPSPQKRSEVDEDEYSNYSVKVLERILHDSRSTEAREDKTRLVNLWKKLDKSVSSSQIHIASLLQDGNIVAMGKKEFVLVYTNAALCNQVMRLSFKQESLKLLYDFLGDTYNYFAIPEEIWMEKRTEYINQYNIGTRFPKLTPIEDSQLNVLEDNREFLNKRESSRSKAVSFFGEELVKIE